MTSLAHIADLVLNRPLLIAPEKLAIIAAVLDGRIGIDMTGVAIDPVMLAHRPNSDAARFANSGNQGRSPKPYGMTNTGAAVVAIAGSLVNRGAWIGASSGLTSYEGLAHQIKTAAADPDVSSIILDVDSPGGEAVGCFETATVIREARKQKPVVAVVNGMACSAAYALAASATKIITTPSGIVGSIGVLMIHADFSRQLDQKGITPTLIFAGANKVDGNPYQPLPAGVRTDLQAHIDLMYGQFIDCIVTGRNGKLSAALAKATEARAYVGADAVSACLADEVGTFETALGGIQSRTPSTPSPASMVHQARTHTLPNKSAFETAYTPDEVAARVNGKVATPNADTPQFAASTQSYGEAYSPEEVAARINGTVSTAKLEATRQTEPKTAAPHSSRDDAYSADEVAARINAETRRWRI